jgi:hypothetical protein
MTTHHPAAEAPVQRIVDAITEAVEARTGAAFYVPSEFKEMLLDQFDAAIREANDMLLRRSEAQDIRIAELEADVERLKDAKEDNRHA